MSLLRSLLIALAAILMAGPLAEAVMEARPWRRRVAWIFLLAPYLTPALLTGYAYANFSLSLVRHPEWNTFFYAALMWMKLTPVAVLVRHFTPRAVSREAFHCRKLLGASRWEQWKFQAEAGTWKGPLAAFVLVFLFAFGEFELASLMYVKTWTVVLFDAHVGGIALGETLRRIAGPVLVEGTALGIAVMVLFRHRAARGQATGHGGLMAWIYLVISTGLVLGVPVYVMLRGTIQGIVVAIENFALQREILASLLIASGATFVVGLLSFWCVRRRWLGVMLGWIGLLGPLVLSLMMLALFQWLGWQETPVPLVLTLAIVLLPLAILLRLVMKMTRPGAALHLTVLMERTAAARGIVWRLKTSGMYWTLFLLFGWAYWDLTASAILAPVTMTPVTVRLYNLMHYGRNAALSSMLFAALAAPLLLWGVIALTRRWWVRS